MEWLEGEALGNYYVCSFFRGEGSGGYRVFEA
jgi:hypothetical protein